MNYAYSIEKFSESYADFEPLYRMHHAETMDRLTRDGIPGYPFNPRLDAYAAANERGDYILFTVRADGAPVGYAGIFVVKSMHSQELIAREDTIYVHPAHRNGTGARLAKKIISALRAAGVTRFDITAMTDERSVKLWERLGFRRVAPQMSLFYKD